MLKKTITYTDYNGTERTEDFYFNMTMPELMELELSIPGGYSGMLQSIVDADDQATILKIFKEIIFKAYGEKSEDGRRFIKSEELSQAFSQTEAYVKLYMDFSTNAEAASEFINGIIPEFDGKQEALQKAFPKTQV